MTFLPDLSTILAYSLACLVLFITPGPDMSLFLAKTMAGGRRAGLAAMNTVLRIAGSPAAARLGGLASRFVTPPAEAIDLPVYPLRQTAP